MKSQALDVNRYLDKGLNGLCHAAHIAGDHWFSGHYGAAVLSAYFLITECQLSDEVKRRVAIWAEAIIQEQPEYFDTCYLGEAKSYELIEDALRHASAELNVAGHGTIYGAPLKTPDFC